MKGTLNFENKKVIIFDLDGTLVDLNVDWMALKKILSERYNKIFEGVSCEFESISGCLDFIVEREDEVELKKFFAIIRDYELEGVPKSNPIEESVYFIQNAYNFGVAPETEFAVFSLNTRACIEAALRLAQIRDKFSFIIGREDVRSWKPDPEGLLKIKERFNVKSEELIYIGDMDKDLEAGANAGINSFYIDEIIKLVKEKKRG